MRHTTDVLRSVCAFPGWDANNKQTPVVSCKSRQDLLRNVANTQVQNSPSHTRASSGLLGGRVFVSLEASCPPSVLSQTQPVSCRQPAAREEQVHASILRTAPSCPGQADLREPWQWDCALVIMPSDERGSTNPTGPLSALQQVGSHTHFCGSAPQCALLL